MLLLRLSGWLLLRLAERRLLGLLFHEPPRRTREDFSSLHATLKAEPSLGALERSELMQSSTSSPRDFHPRALPEPCMNLSIHTAPDVRPLP